jgi:hypothetical protein
MISTFWNIDLINANDSYTNLFGGWIDSGLSRAEARRRPVLQLKNSNHSNHSPMSIIGRAMN